MLLKVPVGEKVVFDDHVRGQVEVPTDAIRDPALLRAPDAAGVCAALYSFATVVDETDFGITHVIRAEEHLSNTAPQVLIFKALGATPPEFAHIPLVNYNGEKMSKRKLPPLGADEIAKLKACGWTEDAIKARDDLNIATVAYYRELGYLPAALINYLVRLGWSLNDTDEFIPLDVVLKNFSLDRVTKAPGNFDAKKLAWLQGEYMKLLTPAQKLEGAMPYLLRAKLVTEPIPDATRASPSDRGSGRRSRQAVLGVRVLRRPILKDVPDYNPKAVADKLAKPGVADRLRAYADELRALEPFDAPSSGGVYCVRGDWALNRGPRRPGTGRGHRRDDRLQPTGNARPHWPRQGAITH